MSDPTHSESIFPNDKYDVEGAIKWVMENGTPLEKVVVYKALWEYEHEVYTPDPFPQLRIVRHRLHKKLEPFKL